MLMNVSKIIRNSSIVSVRKYGHFRIPKAVYDDDGNNMLESDVKPIEILRPVTDGKKRSGEKQSRPRINHKIKRKQSLERKVNEIDQNSRSNYDVLKTFISFNQSKFFCKNNPFLLVEGERLIIDAIQAGLQIKGIYHTNDRPIESFKLVSEALKQRKDINIHSVLESDLKITSKVVTSPGIVAIVSKPLREDIERYRSSLPVQNIMPVTLVAAGLSDPTNMGGLIRSAAAAGVHEILTVSQSVNIWNDKVLRTAAGAHFKTIISEASELTDLSLKLEQADSIICCESQGGEDYFNTQITLSGSTVLLVGNEAAGIPSDVKELLASESLKSKTRAISIPLSSGIDSLNSYVAASIVLFQLKRLFSAKI